MKPAVVIAYQEFPDIALEQEVLVPAGAEVTRIKDLRAPESADLLRRAAALMVSVQKVTDDLLEAMPACLIVERAGAGLDAIDIPAATRRGIWVANVPEPYVEDVATHAIAILLSQVRRLPALFESTRQGRWDQRFVRPLHRPQELTLGVFGFGRIGRTMALKAMGLGMKVIACDAQVPAAAIAATGARAADWPTLLRESDYLTLHAPLTPATAKIVNEQALAAMKPTAFLINTGRGGLIDEDALLRAIQAGRLAGAALDVLTVEPPAPEHPLLHEPRIFVTPHIAWYSETSNREVRVRAAEEVVRVLRGEPPRAAASQLANPRAGRGPGRA
jgi:D-3-phosphoglycerate dehydrogenase / 2-oxoglutarate reductase